MTDQSRAAVSGEAKLAEDLRYWVRSFAHSSPLAITCNEAANLIERQRKVIAAADAMRGPKYSEPEHWCVENCGICANLRAYDAARGELG